MSPRRRTRKNPFIARAAARLTSPLLAAALLPLAAAVWVSAWLLVRSLHLSWRAFWPVPAGAAAYALVQALWARPMGLYVFGHELTHAVAAWLSGYSVKSMKVSAAGGEVITSDTNLFVALAPYCVPIYTLIVAAAFALYRASGAASPPAWCGFGVGLTFAFHAALTVHALRQKQPDLEHGGVFLSLVLIALSNGLVMVLLLKLLFPGSVSLAAFGRRWWAVTRAGASAAGPALSGAWGWIKRRCA